MFHERDMGILRVINNSSGKFGSAYDEKREGLYDKFLKHLTVMFARWIRKSAWREPQMLYKMITQTSQPSLRSGAGQIFCIGESSSQREGLPTWPVNTELWAQDLGVFSLLKPLFYVFCAAVSCIYVEMFTLSCLVSSTSVSDSATSAQGTASL